MHKLRAAANAVWATKELTRPASRRTRTSANSKLRAAGTAVVAAKRASIIRIDTVTLEMERARTRDSDIVRSVPIGRILHRAAEKFGSSKGVAADYALSTPTESIGYFLSHSWHASRLDKFLTLWVFFRLPAATLGALLFSLLGFILTVAEILPSATVTERFSDLAAGGQSSGHALWCSLFSIVGFCVGGMLQGYAERFGVLRGHGAFLDKLCIHQTDNDLKSKGIRSLGLFLRRSRKLFILWSPEYFTRLWCCFEVAAFEQAVREETNHEQTDRIIFRPVQLGAVLAAYGVSVVCMTGGVQLVPVIRGDGDLLLVALVNFFVALTVGIVVVRPIFSYARARADLFHQLQSFSFEKAQCFAESDRALIIQMLTLWHSPDEHDSEAAIQEFDSMVREKLYSLVKQQAGEPLPYKLAAMVCVAASGPFWDIYASRLMVPSSILAEARAIDHTLYLVYLLCTVLMFQTGTLRMFINFGTITYPKRGASTRKYMLHCAACVVLTLVVELGIYYVHRTLFYLLAPRFGLAVGVASVLVLEGFHVVIAWRWWRIWCVNIDRWRGGRVESSWA